MVNLSKKNLIFVITVLIVIFLDQLTKIIFKYKSFYLFSGLLKLELSRNYGAGFSILQGQTPLLVWFSIFIIGLIMYYYEKIPEKYVFYLSLVIGGAIGNLIDRISYGYVIDFVDFNIWSGYFLNIFFKIWPSFNIADLAVFIGIIGLIMYLSKTPNSEKI